MFDSSDGVTHIVIIYERHILPHAISLLVLGGGDLTKYLTKFLVEALFVFNGCELNMFHHMKETMAHVALDFECEIEKGNNYS